MRLIILILLTSISIATNAQVVSLNTIHLSGAKNPAANREEVLKKEFAEKKTFLACQAGVYP